MKKRMISSEKIVDLIIQSEEEARKQIWLIPSENLPSPFSRLALATSAVNRYLFKHDYQGKRLCPGTEIYQQLYDYCVEALKKLFKAKYVSLRPISGMTGMTMVIAAYTEKDDILFSLSPEVGGHTHTEKIADTLGREAHHIPMVEKDRCFQIDCEALGRELGKIRPKLLYLDPMSCQYQFDLTRIREVTPKDCVLHYDTSHVMSFVAGGIYQDPLEEGFDSISGSTHKTLPSVQKGFFATNRKEYCERFERFPGQMVSSLHTSSILALAVTLAETVDFYEKYAEETLKNARFCCERLENAGFTVYGFKERKTDCHVVFLGVEPHCEAIEAAYRLSRANIITHPTTLPIKDPERGLRLGLQEITVLGMGEAEIEMIVDIFRKLLIENEDPEKYADVVSDLRVRFRHPTFSFQDDVRLNKLFNVIFK